METYFDNKKYIELVVSEIKRRASLTKGKLYIEMNGKLLKDDFAQRIFTGYETDTKKKIINIIKNDLDILLCVNAKEIIENTPMTKKQIPCIEHIELTLKRIETATSIKPNLVITHINPEEMYDLIFTFEKKFLKKGYKVREIYLKKGFPYNKDFLLSENGFGNDDHIPIFKKIALVTGIGKESGKFSTSIGQLYQDHEIGLESSYCMFQTLPISNLAPDHPINQAWIRRKEVENLNQDDFGETIEDRSQESFNIIKDLLKDIIKEDNMIHQYNKVSDMIICPTLECITNMEEVKKNAEKE